MYLCVPAGHTDSESFAESLESSQECWAREDGQEEGQQVESCADVVVERCGSRRDRVYGALRTRERRGRGGKGHTN